MSAHPSSVVVSPRGGQLGWEIINKRYVPVSADIGVGPYFSNEIRRRIHQQKPSNVIFCGEPGVSKTYTATALARYVQPNFTDDQITYTYTHFMELMIKLPEGYVILFDEPEYAMGHRDWYKDINKALVATTRSGRFKIHPLFIPTINKSLLDKVIRKYLLQYMVWLDDRGEGQIYRISPNKFDESVMHIPLWKIRVEMLDVAKCPKRWCLNCPRFNDKSCQLLRAKYEHQRKEIQEQRYKEDLEKTKQRESAILYSVQQLEDMAVKIKEKWVWNQKGNIDYHSILLCFEEVYGVMLLESKAQSLSKRLSMKYRETKKQSVS